VTVTAKKTARTGKTVTAKSAKPAENNAFSGAKDLK
jgi:hypothetical protein